MLTTLCNKLCSGINAQLVGKGKMGFRPSGVLPISGPALSSSNNRLSFSMADEKVIMDVPYGHPLHPSYTFWERLPLGNVQVTSL